MFISENMPKPENGHFDSLHRKPLLGHKSMQNYIKNENFIAKNDLRNFAIPEFFQFYY